MPFISVIVPTNRVGGLDVLFAGLAAQTMRDFELVLVDSIYEYRKDIVAEKAKVCRFPVKHVPPRDNPFPLNAYQRSVNTGLTYASGQLSYFTCDYAWLNPNVLKAHAGFHIEHDFTSVAALAPIHIHKTPPVHRAFPNTRYGLADIGDVDTEEGRKKTNATWDVDGIRHDAIKRWVSAYLTDLQSRRLDPFMWSIFEREYRRADDPRNGALELIHIENKASEPAGPIHQYFCHLKNDSFLTQALLDINGFDEDFDGCHLWQDSEVADRLVCKAGVKFYLVLDDALVHLIDVHHLMTIRQILRHERTNEAIMFAKRQTGYATPTNPHLNLSQLRRDALSTWTQP